MSQETIQAIVDKAESLTLSDFKKLQYRLDSMLQQRSESFITALKNADIKRLKELVELGVNFEDKKILNRLYDLSLSNTNKETFEYLYNLNIKVNPLPAELIDGYIACKRELNPNRASSVDTLQVLKYFLKAGLVNTLKNYKFSDEVFELGKNHIEPNQFFEIAKNAVSHFAQFEDMNTYSNTHAYIQSNASVFIPILINNIKKEENLKLFLNIPMYKGFLDKYIENDKEGTLMDSAVSNAAYAKMITLYKMGVCFPLKKEPYSKLFAKADPLVFDAQKYVISHIDNITVGNQVILKTILHYSDDHSKEKIEFKKGLLTLVLNRYTKDQLELLPEALKKREPSELVDLVNKYHDYALLSNEIEAKSNENTIDSTSRKLKI